MDLGTAERKGSRCPPAGSRDQPPTLRHPESARRSRPGTFSRGPTTRSSVSGSAGVGRHREYSRGQVRVGRSHPRRTCATQAGPTKAESGYASSDLPPSMKCRGASTCVPQCTSISMRLTFTSSPATKLRVRSTWIPTLPGHTGMPGLSRTEMSISRGIGPRVLGLLVVDRSGIARCAAPFWRRQPCG